MKKILIVLLTLALVAGFAFAGGNKDAEKTWTVSGGLNIEGQLNLGVDEGPKPGDSYSEPSIEYGDLVADFSIKMEKEIADGTFGLSFAIDLEEGEEAAWSLGANWKKSFGESVLSANTGLSYNSDDDEYKLGFGVGYAAPSFGANFSANTKPGAEGTFEMMKGWELDALNGWFSVLDGDLAFSVRYVGGRANAFSLGHSVIARTWDNRNKAIQVVYTPTALIEGLTVGVAVQDIGEGRAKDQIVDGLLFGVKFQNDMFGAKFVFDNGYRGLWSDINDDDDGWMTNLNAINNFNTKTGMQIGVDVVFGDLYIAVDSEILGLDDPLKVSGFFGLGAEVGYDDDALNAKLTLKMYTALQDKDKMAGSDAGVFAILPSLGYNVIPETLRADLDMAFIIGFGDRMSDIDKNAWSSIMVNPSVTWNVLENVEVGLGWTLELEGFEKNSVSNEFGIDIGWTPTKNVKVSLGWALTAEKAAGADDTFITDHNISLGFGWSF